jgi:hypothetical protein
MGVAPSGGLHGMQPGSEGTTDQQPDADAADLPEHERDQLRRRPSDPRTESEREAEAALPEHEQDDHRGQDTGGPSDSA